MALYLLKSMFNKKDKVDAVDKGVQHKKVALYYFNDFSVFLSPERA